MLSNGSTSTTNLLPLVLRLLDGLTALLLSLQQSLSDETVLGLELHQCLHLVVDDAKSRGLSAAELGTEAEEDDQFGVGLVHTADLFLQVGLGDVGAARMDNINNHLCALRKSGGEADVRREFEQEQI